MLRAIARSHLVAFLMLVFHMQSCLGFRELGRKTGIDRPPRLFFLFMADSDMPNLDIWHRFFSKVKQGVDYQAFLHCQHRHKCLEAHPDIEDNFHVIDTVESVWCQDLVTPMNALLAAALDHSGGQHAGSGNENDKFIFLSDTTVPLKTFGFVKNKLLVRDAYKSNFCIQPWPKWAWYKAETTLAKHSQWSVLSRAHASKALLAAENFKPAKIWRQMTPVRWLGVEWYAPKMWQLRKLAGQITHSAVLDVILTLFVPAVRGCPDEFWHMAAAVGGLNRKEATTGVLFDELSGEPLRMNEEYADSFQGHCDTFAIIDVDSRELAIGLTGNGTTVSGMNGFLRPHIHAGKFTKLSVETLGALGASEYLFTRKMDNTTRLEGDLNLTEAFDQIIFSDDRI